MTLGYLFDLKRENNALSLRIDLGWSPYMDLSQSPYNVQAQDKIVTLILIEPEMIDNLLEILTLELDGVLLYEFHEKYTGKMFIFEGGHTDEPMEFRCKEIRELEIGYSNEELIIQRNKLAQKLSESQGREVNQSRQFSNFIHALTIETLKELDKNERKMTFFATMRPEKSMVATAKVEAYEHVLTWIKQLQDREGER